MSRWLRAALAVLAVSAPLPGAAQVWGGIAAFAPEAPRAAMAPAAPALALSGLPSLGADPQAEGDGGLCIAEILAAEARHDLPRGLLLTIGLAEAGRRVGGVHTVWPWTVNVEGKGHVFASRAEAVGFVRAQEAAGRRLIDVGCMQVNRAWHPEAFPTLEAGFDPASNVEYSARFLAALHDEFGDWRAAAGAYHSRTPGPRADYLALLTRTRGAAERLAEAFRSGDGQATEPAPAEPAEAESPDMAEGPNLLPGFGEALERVDVAAIAAEARSGRPAVMAARAAPAPEPAAATMASAATPRPGLWAAALRASETEGAAPGSLYGAGPVAAGWTKAKPLY